MKPRRVNRLLTIALGLCGLATIAAAQRSTATQATRSNSCASGSSSGTVTVHSASSGSPFLNLCEGRALGGSVAQAGQSIPLALASGDFDEDGVADLVSGFAEGSAGSITVYRGNVAALWPYGAALRNGPPAAFFASPRKFSVPEMPDFIVIGDFDADGHLDVVTARRGSTALYLLRGDGRGGFRAARHIALDGTVTAMISGEINRADGLADLIVAVNTANGPRALVYESPAGALAGSPEIFKLAKPATALALSKFDGNAMNDLAIACGNQLVVIHARDRKLSLDEAQRASVAPARVTVQNLPFSIQTLVAGDFTGAGPSVAALGDDAKVHIFEHTVAPGSLTARMASDPDFRPTMQLSKPDKDGRPIILGGTMTPGKSAQFSAMRESMRAASSSAEWTERSATALPSGFAQAHPHLVAGRLTGSMQEDLIAVDSGNSKIHVLSTNTGRERVSALNRRSEGVSENLTSGPVAMKVVASLDAIGAPAVVLPMRLSQHGLNGLVMLQAGQSEPTLMPQDVPPANVFTVTNTSDAIIMVGPEYTGPAGSLRKALYDASQADGTSSIVFNIPTTDPGYNHTTGTFLIQPLSESVPGALNDFALPPINATVTIDGYTQPGASPNTLANGDNARLLIQIDGGKATTPGGTGLSPFDDVGSVYRGLIFTGWTNPDISTTSTGSTASGAEGMEANGVQDFIEGNFFGTDSTGKVAAPNRIGVFADNGPGFGSTAGGNIIGGTTPQARNILSGNDNSGVLFLSTALEAQLQGNFIGLDITGAAIVSNPQEADRSNSFDGAGLNGATITIGGTLPGTGNVIAGNGTNVDINDLTEGGQATDSLVQGNLIGTDATGKIGIANQGYGVSILHNPTDMLIGGTTPAARNVISGNLSGVYIFDNSFYNNVQGNYIGTDITGAKAVGNINQGFISGATTSDAIPAGYTTIGGSMAGAGNVISGNAEDGVQISGTSTSQSYPNPQVGNTVQGNFIGTDATGKTSIPNGGNGIDLLSSATNNIIGGSAPGSANLIANNTQNGVLIDPGTGSGNNTIANIILANKGAGVRINTGTSNRISQNSIFGNGNLGINLQNAGANLNTNCNASNTGANNLQNAPSLTGGSGTTFITATATDPNGNTSEFSNAVPASASGNIVSLLGNFNSTANTKYTIEFFSSTAADPSGYGEGQTYLTSTSVTTGSDCKIAINNPVDTTKADVAVTLSSDTTVFNVGPDFGEFTFTGTVTNNGPAIAHNVVFTDTLPAGLEISSAYCNVGPCQTPATTTLGNCTVNGNKITCNMGTMAAGATAQITLPVQATAAGTLNDAASVTATEADPVPANNTATLGQNVDYPFPFIDHLDPSSGLTTNSGSLLLNVYGNGFLPTSAVTFNGTAVTTKAYLDNQVCGGPFQPGFCSAIQVSVPASLLGTAGTATVTVTNPDPGPGGESNEPSSANFTLVSDCTYDAEFFGFNPVEADGDTLIPESIEVSTNAPSCAWTAQSNASWLVILDNASSTGSGSLDVSVAPNTGAARNGTLTVAGQTVEIDQEAGDSTICTYGLNPASAHIPAGGSSSTFAVTTASSCSYFVEPYPQDSTYVTGVQFITIPQTSSLLVGNGNPAYTVAANHGAPRTGAIMVGGDVFTLTQDAPACYYTLSSTATTVGVTGGTGSITVTPSSSSCAWTAKSSDTTHLSVTSGASGTGNGTVNYSVPVNTEGPQSPTLTIGDANGYTIFTETQVSAFNCTFTIAPGSIEVSSNGISNFFGITASYGNCKWTATSSDPTALTIGDVTGAAGLSTNGSAVGTGVVYYRVAQNTTGAPRTITITAGCQTFTVNQDGATTAPAASLSPSGLTFTANTGSTSAGQTVTLTNTGSAALNISGISITGTNPTDFAQTNTCSGSLAANASCSISVTFTPASAASFAATLSVADNATGSPQTVTLSGTGTAAAAPATSLSPTSLTFSAASGSTSAAQVVTLKNTGTAALTISGITIAGTNPTDFAQTNTCGSSLAANASCSISVTFTPASAASFAAMLSIADNATGSPQTVTLSGTGTAAAAPVTSLSPTSLTFSAVSGSTSTAQTVTLKNTGTAALAISGITIAGTNPTDFAQTNTCGNSLAANASCSISVTFTPASAASFAAMLSIADNATGSPQTVTLSGTGTAAAAPAVSLSPSSLSFTTNTGTTSPAQTVMLKNTGSAALTISGISITGTNPTDFAQTNTCGSSLAANASCSISVTFTPASAASFAATLSVADNATGSPHTVALSGTGNTPLAPQPSLTPSALTFANTTVGTTATAQNIKLENVGTAALAISSIAITGANPTDFSQTNNCGSSLAIDDSCMIAVTFTPASAASFAATLTVTDNAAPTTQTAALSGTGIAADAPVVSLTPSSLSFTAVTGTTTAAQSAILKNTGNAPLAISGITVGGSNATDFAQTNTCAGSLDAGASCSIAVTFSPASAASFTATLSVADSAAGSPHTVSLSGTGTPLPSFIVSSSTTAQTVQAGGTAQYSIVATAQNGTFAGTVTLAATGLPPGATATFAPASISPGSSTATSQLSVQTATATTAASAGSRGWLMVASMLPLAGLLFATRRLRRRWLAVCILMLASLGALTALSGCGGGFGLPGSNGKTYTITVTGTSGAEQQSTTVQLTVQ
jgi:uncharacterized repeat protein (TIGR01451 family)